MKPYPDYKPTGLAWLPEIPKHWKSAKLRNLLSIVSRKNHPEQPLLSVVREKGVIRRDVESKEENHNYIPEDLSNYKLVRKGQFAMNKMKAWQGSYGISQYDGIVSPAYFVFDLHGVSADFFNTAIRSKAYIPYFAQASDGIRVGQWDLSLPRMHEIPFFIPPADEQAQIVRYLDAMTAKINKLIRAKKTVNDLIMEQLIEEANRCVNDKKLKRYRLKNILTLVSDEIDRKDDILYSPVGVLNRGRGVFHKPELLGKELGDSTFFHVYPGDMIFSGQFAWEGAVGILQDSEKGCIASHRYPLARAVDPDVLKLEYLWAFFQTKYGDMILNTHSYGAAGRNRPLNIQRLLAEDIPLPSIAEQNDFVILFRQLQKAKSLATKYTKQLQDYKDALIAAVVTGKVDVRNIAVEAVAPEDLSLSDDPDESEEQDSLTSEESEE